MKLYFKFLSYALARLNTFNLLFQREGCGIYHLLGETKALQCTYLSLFVDNDILSNADDLLTIDFEGQTLQVDNNTLDIGTAARRYISSIEEECESAPILWFYEAVRQGYVAVVKMLLGRFLFKSSTLGFKTTTCIRKSTKVQTLGGIWWKYCIFGLKTLLHACV